MDVSMNIHGTVDMDMDGKFHIHGKPAYSCVGSLAVSLLLRAKVLML